MRIIIDTNVVISGIFFGGLPYEILRLWQKRKLKIVLTEEILKEYTRVCEELSKKLGSGNMDKILSLISLNSEAVTPAKIANQICDDPDDDKFIACALGGGVRVIVSGDSHLLRVNGIFDLEIIKPKKFLEKYYSDC